MDTYALIKELDNINPHRSRYMEFCLGNGGQCG